MNSEEKYPYDRQALIKHRKESNHMISIFCIADRIESNVEPARAAIVTLDNMAKH